ncbi:MAG: VWA domain-containing protein [Bryobacteraceae bacterium]
MIPRLTSGVFLLLAICASTAHTAPPPERTSRATANLGSAPQFRADSSVVIVNASVTDSRGHAVAGLPPASFHVFEDGIEQKIAYFSTDDAPVSMTLVLDYSFSMKPKFKLLRQAVAELMKASDPADEFCLIGFRDRPEAPLGFTDAAEIESRLISVEPRGNTALLDAVDLGLRSFKRANHARRALLIVSDGEDNHSRLRPWEVKSAAREADGEIYAIRLDTSYRPVGKPREVEEGAALLEDIAGPGGGAYYDIDDVRELPGMVRKIGEQLRHEYVLGYVPNHSERDGKYRRIRLKLSPPSGQPRLSARWKRGYYSPAD